MKATRQVGHGLLNTPKKDVFCRFCYFLFRIKPNSWHCHPATVFSACKHRHPVSNIASSLSSEDTLIKFMTDGVLLREVETVGDECVHRDYT